jgi:hypothetical protein
MQVRAAAVESELYRLREQERVKVVKDLLSALRNTSAGNLIAALPDSTGANGPDATTRGLLEALMETFRIRPVHHLGDRVPISDGQIPQTIELDRPIGDVSDEVHALEVTAVGWSYDGKLLLPPIARPVIKSGELIQTVTAAPPLRVES